VLLPLLILYALYQISIKVPVPVGPEILKSRQVAVIGFQSTVCKIVPAAPDAAITPPSHNTVLSIGSTIDITPAVGEAEFDMIRNL
jgi:hypothetical protein